MRRAARTNTPMSIEILDESGREGMRRAGRVARRILREIVEHVGPGVSTAELDIIARRRIERAGARSSQLGYHGFPAAICTSPNEVVCHGVPSPRVILASGDLVNVDVTVNVDGWHGDTSLTVEVGRSSPERRHVMQVAARGLERAIAMVRPGVRLGDIGAALQDHAEAHGCGSVVDYCGHGIGRRMHQPPQVVHAGPAGRGVRLRAGMCFTLEPMLTLGSPGTRVLDDGWTVVTCDGSPSAQFEHTLLVTEAGVEVLTADR